MSKEKEITWRDIEELLEEGEIERRRLEKINKEQLRVSRERRRIMEKTPKSKEYTEFFEKLKKEKPYKPLSSVDEFSERTEDKIDRYIKSIERKTQKELAKLRKQEIKYLRKKPGLLGTPKADYFRIKHRRKNLQELVRALKRTFGGLEEELQLERLESEYEQPNLLSRIWNYIKGGSKKVKNAYLVLLALFLIYLIFRDKSSIIGYTVVEAVTESGIISYFLIFILIICLVAFYKLDN